MKLIKSGAFPKTKLFGWLAIHKKILIVENLHKIAIAFLQNVNYAKQHKKSPIISSWNLNSQF